MAIQFKITLQSSNPPVVKLFGIEQAPTTFTQLVDVIRSNVTEFARSAAPLNVTYRDSDGDLVLIDSDESWSAVLDLETKWKQRENEGYGTARPFTIRLNVSTQDASGAFPSAAGIPNVSEAHQRTPPNLHELFQAFSAFAGPAAAACMSAFQDQEEQAQSFQGHPTQEEQQQQREVEATDPAVHEGVSCDGCGVTPICGLRYKSATRDDFDLCENCEALPEKRNDDLYIKIRHPGQAPSFILCVPRDTTGSSCPFPRGFGFHPARGRFGHGFRGHCGRGRGHCPARQAQREETELEKAIYESLKKDEMETTSAAAPQAAPSSNPAPTPTPTPSAPQQMDVETDAPSSAAGDAQQPNKARLWQSELLSLAQMGFCDFDLNIELLEKHCVAPDGTRGARGARGMEKVLGDLLSM